MSARKRIGLVEEAVADLARDQLAHRVEVAVEGLERLLVVARRACCLVVHRGVWEWRKC